MVNIHPLFIKRVFNFLLNTSKTNPSNQSERVFRFQREYFQPINKSNDILSPFSVPTFFPYHMDKGYTLHLEEGYFEKLHFWSHDIARFIRNTYNNKFASL